jgi:hypothetical protein
MNIDLAELRLHIDLLHKTDTRLRFLDRKHVLPPRKGTFSTDEIQALVLRGYDSYIVVGNGGDRDEDIISLPAGFGEHDHGSMEWQRDAWLSCGLPEPTFQLWTGGKSVHNYWVWDGPIPPALWTAIQKRLISQADFDPTIVNPSRVMRLAGCPHQGTGELCRVISASGKTYDAQAFHDALDPVAQEVRPLPRETYASRSVQEVLDALQVIPPRPGRGTGTYAQYRNILWGLRHALEEAGDPDPLETSITLMESHSPDGWDVRQVATSGGDRIGAGTFWYWAKDAGYRFKGTSPQERQAALVDALTIDPDAWARIRSGFTPDGKLGKLKAHDAALILAADLQGALWWNEMSSEIILDQQPISEHVLANFYITLQARGWDVQKTVAQDALLYAAQLDTRHPLRQYLDSCQNPLPSEDWENIAQLLLGAHHTQVDSAIIRKWLIQCVARAYVPGSPFGHIPILAGLQRKNKSRFFAALGGEFFLGEFTKDKSDRDDLVTLHRFWIVEFGELDGGLAKHSNAHLKAFFSRPADSFRRAYAKGNEWTKRTFNACGTTNKEVGFFTDETGNRRYAVIHVGLIDIGLVESIRDRIWASARADYLAGTSWFLSDDEADTINDHNATLMVEDPWEVEVERLLKEVRKDILGFVDTTGQLIVSTQKVLALIEPEKARRQPHHLHRIAQILIRLGYVQVRARPFGGGNPTRGYAQSDGTGAGTEP